MQIIIEGIVSVAEQCFREQRVQELTKIAYERHKENIEKWEKGEPVKAWFSSVSDVVVEYQNGEQWYYIDVELPFPTYGRIDNL